MTLIPAKEEGRRDCGGVSAAQSELSRALLALLTVAWVQACGAGPPPAPQYGPQAPSLTLAVIVDDAAVRAARPAPIAFTLAVGNALLDRGLRTATVPAEDIASRYSMLRDTEGRLRDLATRAGDGVAVVVEAQAEFYSAISGQHRWTLHVALAVGEAGRGAPIIRRFALPVVVAPHQRGAAVLATASPEVARRLTRLVDDYLAGRAVTPEPEPALGDRPSAAVDDPTADSIYFVLLDRFHNGDLGNDAGADPDDPKDWHGGDLAGLQQKLDYLADLGVKTLWLSPVFAARAAPWMGHSAFHGYWTEDLAQIDPRFGAPADLEALVTAAHGRGMRVLLDLVVNHVGYDTRLVRTQPQWFHDEGTIEDWSDPTQLVRRRVHGLPDLAQENPAVFEYLLTAARRWAKIVDGFRLDAVKHVPLSFWARFNGTLAAEFPGLVLLGELFEGAPAAVDRTRREGGFSQMFDFPLSFALRDVFCEDRPLGRIGAVLAADRLYADPARTLVTFIDNHDLPRVLSLCGGDVARVQHALTAQFAMRGVPAVNYGTEAGLTGREAPSNRSDMVFEGAQFTRLTAHLRALHRLREVHPALVKAKTRVLTFDDARLVFVRATAEDAVLVVINGGAAAEFEPPARVKGTLVPLLGAHPRHLPARSTTLFAVEGALGHLATDHGPTVSVAVEAQADLAEGERLRLVGSAPEVGDWDPKKGVELTAAGDGRYTGRIDIPEGLVLAYKLVVETDVAPRWETRPNRYTLTAAEQVLRPVYGDASAAGTATL